MTAFFHLLLTTPHERVKKGVFYENIFLECEAMLLNALCGMDSHPVARQTFNANGEYFCEGFKRGVCVGCEK